MGDLHHDQLKCDRKGLANTIMQNLKDLKLLLSSSVPIILVETHEENRVMSLFKRLIVDVYKPLYRWSVTEGLKRLDIDKPAQLHNRKPIELLTQIKMTSDPGIYVLIDFHPYIDDPMHTRLLKDITLMHGDVPHTIVMVSHELKIPKELDRSCARFNLSLPDRSQLEVMIRHEAKVWSMKIIIFVLQRRKKL